MGEEVYPLTRIVGFPSRIDVTTGKMFLSQSAKWDIQKKLYPPGSILRIIKVHAVPNPESSIYIYTDRGTLWETFHKWTYYTSGGTTCITIHENIDIRVKRDHITYMRIGGAGSLRFWVEVITDKANVVYKPTEASRWTWDLETYDRWEVGIPATEEYVFYTVDLGKVYEHVDLGVMSDTYGSRAGRHWLDISEDGTVWTYIDVASIPEDVLTKTVLGGEDKTLRYFRQRFENISIYDGTYYFIPHQETCWIS